jgi:hypothetical protein
VASWRPCPQCPQCPQHRAGRAGAPAAARHMQQINRWNNQQSARLPAVGDAKRAAEIVRILGGKKQSFSCKAPTRAPKRTTLPDGTTKTEWGKGDELDAESLAALWRDFAAEKFRATDAEADRPERANLGPASRRRKDRLSLREKETALKVLKKMKATGRDGFPIELYQKNVFCREQLFKLIDLMWKYEMAPADMLQGVFCPIYKNKGSAEDLTKYLSRGIRGESVTCKAAGIPQHNIASYVC